MSMAWDEDPSPESVERLMRRHQLVSNLIERKGACPRCAERARLAESYRRKWEAAECRIEQMEEEQQADPWTTILAVVLGLLATAVVVRILTSPIVLRALGER